MQSDFEELIEVQANASSTVRGLSFSDSSVYVGTYHVSVCSCT